MLSARVNDEGYSTLVKSTNHGVRFLLRISYVLIETTHNRINIQPFISLLVLQSLQTSLLVLGLILLSNGLF